MPLNNAQTINNTKKVYDVSGFKIFYLIFYLKDFCITEKVLPLSKWIIIMKINYAP